MNVVNNSNARTTNVLDNLNQCKNFINMETDAIITTCAMTYFGISSLDMPVDEVIPPHILNGSDDEKRLWYHRHVKSMVSKYVMNKESEIFHSMVEGVQQHNRPKSRDIYNCRVCNKEYRYKKAMENHETKKHDYVHKDESSTDTSEETEKSKSTDKSDCIYNYACVRLSMGLFVRNFDDAVREGDGQRIIKCWKYMTSLTKIFYRMLH
jgi:serine palmitoyltransferase